MTEEEEAVWEAAGEDYDQMEEPDWMNGDRVN